MKQFTWTLALCALLVPQVAAQDAEAVAIDANEVFGGRLTKPLGVETVATRQPAVHAWTGRTRLLVLDGEVFESLERGDASLGARFEMELFEGESVTLEPESVRRSDFGAHVVRGEIAAPRAGRFTLAHESGVATVHLRFRDGSMLYLRTLEAGVHYVQEIFTDRMPDCGVTREWQASQAPMLAGNSQESQALPGGNDIQVDDTPFRLDILFPYTPAALESAGDIHAALRTQVEVAVDEGNEAFDNSSISNFAMCIVGFMQVDFDETGQPLSSTLSDLFLGSGNLDAIPDWRDACGADNVSLIADGDHDPGFLGWGYILPLSFSSVAIYQFNVTAIDALPGFTLIHELGHNMGCEHDRNDNNQPTNSYPYAYGWAFDDNDGDPHHTIMGRNSLPGPRELHYSNPGVVFVDGGLTGEFYSPFLEDVGADNASVIGNNRDDLNAAVPSAPKITFVYVDPLYPGGLTENGSVLQPYNTLQEGFLRVQDGGTIEMKNSTAPGTELPPLAQNVRIRPNNVSSVTLGN